MSLDKLAAFLAGLKQKAERATPGPWDFDDHDDFVSSLSDADPRDHAADITMFQARAVKLRDGEGRLPYEVSDADGEYVAAFDPEVCMALLRIAEASADIHEDWCSGSHVAPGQCKGCPAHQVMWAMADLRKLAEGRAS